MGSGLNRICQAVNIRRRCAQSDIRAKQTARRILRNTEKSCVGLCATDQNLALVEHIVDGCVVLARQFKSNQSRTVCWVKRHSSPETWEALCAHHPTRSEIEEPLLNVLDSKSREKVNGVAQCQKLPIRMRTKRLIFRDFARIPFQMGDAAL